MHKGPAGFGLPLPVDVAEQNGQLALAVRRENSPSMWQADWARAIYESRPGPYGGLVFDLRHLHHPCSSFFSGSLWLHQAYGLVDKRIALQNAGERVRAVIEVLHVHDFFVLRA
ncbi:MAG: hypothetical protein ACOCYV_00840 [Planctomycetota bacterium]